MRWILDKLTYHAVYDASVLDGLCFAAANGFAGIQAAVETPHLSFDGLSAARRGEIRRFCVEHGVSVSLHAPDEAASLFTPSRRLADGVFTYFAGLFDFAEAIGSHLITLHVGSPACFSTDAEPPADLPPEDADAWRAIAKENLDRLIDLGAGRFVLCVENYALGPIAMAAVQQRLGGGRLALCWDLAKAWAARTRGGRDEERFFRRNIEHVRQVHLHDLRDGRSHRVIGTGEVDFMQFLPDLARVDVAEYCIEVRPRQKAADSLERLRGLLTEHALPQPAAAEAD